jgi:hypothetical protein
VYKAYGGMALVIRRRLDQNGRDALVTVNNVEMLATAVGRMIRLE